MTTQEFTPAAQERWESLSGEVQRSLLASVWCTACRDAVPMTNVTGVLRNNDLLLVGSCAVCRGDVARVVVAG